MELGDAEAADLLLGHGHLPPLEGVVRDARGGVGTADRVVVLRQHHGKAVKVPPRQFPGGAPGDGLVAVAQPLPYRDADVSHAPVPQLPAQISDPVIAAGEDKGASVALDLPRGIVGAAVGRYQVDVLPGGVAPGTEVHQAADPRQGLHLVSLQQGVEVLGPGIKTDISAEEHRYGPCALRGDGLGDVFRQDRPDQLLPRIALQEPGRADEQAALVNGPPGRQGQGVRISHPNANQIDLHRSIILTIVSCISSMSSPCSSTGRSTTRRAQPASRAASAFSRNPP